MTFRPRSSEVWVVAALLTYVMSAGARAADWPQWRGPNLDGSTTTENVRSYDAFGTGTNDVSQGKTLALGQ